jgi:hypothetical protein
MAVSFESKLKKYLKNIEIMKTPSCLDTDTIGFYIENKLPKGEKMWVEKHISSCLYCLNQLTELKELVYFQKQSAPLPSNLLQKVKDLLPKEEKHPKAFLKDIFYPFIQRISDFFTLPIRQWRYTTVSLATALAVILIMIIYRGVTPEKPFEIEKIQQPRGFTMLSLKEVKTPIIIETGDIDDTFEKVRRLIQAHNGKMQEAVWIENGIKLIFNLRGEEETYLFNELNKLGRTKIEKEGYKDKKGNIVVLLKEKQR